MFKDFFNNFDKLMCYVLLVAIAITMVIGCISTVITLITLNQYWLCRCIICLVSLGVLSVLYSCFYDER